MHNAAHATQYIDQERFTRRNSARDRTAILPETRKGMELMVEERNRMIRNIRNAIEGRQQRLEDGVEKEKEEPGGGCQCCAIGLHRQRTDSQEAEPRPVTTVYCRIWSTEAGEFIRTPIQIPYSRSCEKVPWYVTADLNRRLEATLERKRKEAEVKAIAEKWIADSRAWRPDCCEHCGSSDPPSGRCQCCGCTCCHRCLIPSENMCPSCSIKRCRSCRMPLIGESDGWRCHSCKRPFCDDCIDGHSNRCKA